MPSKTEANIQKEIMLALSQAGCTVWRNNTGAFKDGDRFIKYGLCKGSSDLISIAPNGKFLAVEVKTAKGKPTKEQINFIEQVRMKGGIAFVARSAEEAINELRRYL